MSDIYITNIQTVPDRNVKRHLGMVTGTTIRAKHVGKDFFAGLKNFVGGEIPAYTELLEEARVEATNRMIDQAKERGANAVINVRYSTAAVAPGAAEIVAYGTAIEVE